MMTYCARRIWLGCGRLSDDLSFPSAFPNFEDVRYWMQEYEALVGIAEQL
jgi:hypothetical protein